MGIPLNISASERSGVNRANLMSAELNCFWKWPLHPFGVSVVRVQSLWKVFKVKAKLVKIGVST